MTTIEKLGKNLELEEIIQIEDGQIAILDENLAVKNIIQVR
jgi:hypothetical protein